MKDLKEQLIEYWKSHLRGFISYDSPNYEEELQNQAEQLYKMEINGKIYQNEEDPGVLIEINWDQF